MYSQSESKQNVLIKYSDKNKNTHKKQRTNGKDTLRTADVFSIEL